MSYQALYRKWRPETFGELVGQDAVMTTLKNQVRSDRIGHAYLFCGTRGTGKTSAAKIMARAVNCPHAAERGGEPCNECEICKSIKNGSSMNVFEIDAASNNGVDNIRSIREEVEYPPVNGRYKVYIIDEVHMLSAGAFNALLKTLEEPPAYVIFILATTDPQKIPATILSRCQRYDFRRMSKKTAADRLRFIMRNEGMDAEDKAVNYIAEAADGSMRDALSLLDQCMSYHEGEKLTYDDVLKTAGASDPSVYSGLYRHILSGDTESALITVNGIIDSGTDIVQLTGDMIWYLRNVLLAGSASRGAEDILDISEERFEMAKSDAALSNSRDIAGMLSGFAELLNRMRNSAQKRALLEVLIIRLCTGKEKKEPSAGYRAQDDPKDSAPLRTISAADDMEKKDARPAAEPVQERKSPEEIRNILKENWQELIGKLKPSNRPLFAGTVLKEEHGSLVLVFKNGMNFKLASKNIEENGVLRLRELAKELTGENIRFMARVARPGEIDQEKDRATDEELSRINFHVEIED